MNPRVAIVILNWNGRDMLRRFLPTVVRRSAEPGVVVYVADNGSTDGSCDLVRRDYPAVKLIALDRNYGFAEGYNRALAAVEAEYVVLLNSDVEPDADWLRPLIEYMDAHPDTAACQPKLLSHADPRRYEYAGACGGYIDRYGYPFCRGRLMGTVEDDHGQYDDPAQVMWASGAALFIRLADYRAVGGLDGRFFAHMEEIDLCWRLGARGRKVVCIPQSSVRHVGAATLKRDNPHKTLLNFRNSLLMLYKNLPTDRELRHVMRVRRLLDIVAATVFLMRGQWRSAWAVVQARRRFRRMRPDFETDRRDNLRLSTTPLYGRTTTSLLYAYYLRRRHTFAEL